MLANMNVFNRHCKIYATSTSTATARKFRLLLVLFQLATTSIVLVESTNIIPVTDRGLVLEEQEKEDATTCPETYWLLQCQHRNICS